jgi:hypothetical protein
MNKTQQQRFLRRVTRLLLKVDYPRRPGIRFGRRANSDGCVFWVEDWVVNSDTGKSGLLRGQLWFVEPQFSEDGIVRQAFRAIQAFEEHELREFFLYKGKKVFNPHKRFIV